MRINFELLDIRAFLAVLEFNGFHKAARVLNMSQPALSRRIQSLEAAIGTPLLERSSRSLGPTAAGRSFAPLAHRLLEEFEDSTLGLAGVSERHLGQITLACVPTAAFYFLPRTIERFNAQFPGARFRVLDLSANDCLESVRRGEAEFGINFVGSSDPELTFTPLMDDPYVLACRRDHRLASKRQVAWKDLQNEMLIGVSRASGNRSSWKRHWQNRNCGLIFNMR
jgi:DNA-binding transcriptional LysR family regulator